MVGIIEFIDDPIMLIILFLGILIGLIIKSRLLIVIVFGLTAISGLKHYLMGNFIVENTVLTSILFIGLLCTHLFRHIFLEWFGIDFSLPPGPRTLLEAYIPEKNAAVCDCTPAR